MATPPSPLVRNPTTHVNPWEPQTDHSNGHPRDANLHANGNYSPTSSTPPLSPIPTSSSSSSSPPPPSDRDPAAISLRAFALGAALSASLLTTLYLSPLSNRTDDHPNRNPTPPPTTTPPWRLPSFLLLLSLFHFLEFYTTAVSNPAAATLSAFLLSSNGRAYNIAHCMAFAEAFAHHRFFPGYARDVFPPAFHTAWLGLGAAMLVVGQGTRTAAMVHAGSNFSHLIQSRKKQGHVLVTGGVYRHLRHPSYFGFFWWGLGTQVVLGNVLCLAGYALVLWRFFRRRIESECCFPFRGMQSLGGVAADVWVLCAEEETLLVGFFGMDYVRYRDRTRVGIPFIQ